MDALRTLINSQITNLVQEFGRVDEPRPGRVIAYFSALAGSMDDATKLSLGGPGALKSGSLASFSQAAVYNNTNAWVTTDTDAAQIAGFNLLLRYVQDLAMAWTTYDPTRLDPFDPWDPAQLSLRLERANILLPSVEQANDYVRQAWISVGFSESEQRSMANRFDGLGGKAKKYASMTPGDLADWVDSFSDDGLSALSGSGRYGLGFVTNQADSIFWVVGAVIYTIKYDKAGVQQPSLLQYMDNERVLWSLLNLLTQLDGLADLAIPLPLN